MSLTFTPTGLQIQTFEEILAELVTGYQGIYGSDINIDPDSPDGQRIGIEAKLIADFQAFALSLYTQLDPDFAAGVIQNMIIKLSGITRGPASRSQADVIITTDRILILPVGYQVDDDLGQAWITTAETALVTGSNAVTLVSKNFGNVTAGIGKITEPATIVIGVLSVTNAAAAIPGREEETNQELRERRNLSLEASATSAVGGIYSALANLAGVTDLQVYENDTDIADVVLPLNAHSIWCVVEGGTISDIVKTIALNKTGGTGIKGLVSGTFNEILVRPDGTTFTLVHTMLFDRPIQVPLYITLDVTAVGGAIIDQARIKEGLASRVFRIADHVTAGRMYSFAYTEGEYYVTNLLISDDNITFTDGRLDPAANEKYTLSVANITITVTP